MAMENQMEKKMENRINIWSVYSEFVGLGAANGKWTMIIMETEIILGVNGLVERSL